MPLLDPTRLSTALQTTAPETWSELGDRIGIDVSSGDFAVGWGTLSLINAGLAQGKNRSGLGWFLLSLFLGPFATFILVLLPKLSFYEE